MEVVCSPEQQRLGKRRPQEGAPRHAAYTDVGEEAILSPGLHHAAALQHFKGITTAAAGPPAPAPHPEEKAPRLEACGCRAWTRGFVWLPPLIHKAPQHEGFILTFDSGKKHSHSPVVEPKTKELL